MPGSRWVTGCEIASRQLFAKVPELLSEGVETTTESEQKRKIWWTMSSSGRWELLIPAVRTVSVDGFFVKMGTGNDAGLVERGFSLDSGAGFLCPLVYKYLL